MKKIYSLILTILAIFSLCSFTNREIEVGVINDNTSINNDLVSLGLTPSDYITLEDTTNNNSYDEVYLIAVGENRQSEEYTDVYLYFYNPLLNDIYQDYYFDMKINNYTYSFGYLETEREWSYYEDLYDEPDFLLELCEYDSNHNITKVKFNYKYNENERIYNLDRIERLTDERSFFNPFSATFKEREEDGKLVTDYDYNSFIYITEDEIVQLHFDDLTVFKDTSIILDFLVGIFGSAGMGNAIYFYNFSSSKNIDQILESDIDYILHTHQGYYSKPLFGDLEFDGVDNYKTISTTIYSTDESEIMVYDQLEKFEAFKTPSSDRLNEFTDAMNITDEVKNKFINYQHSICFLVATNNDSRNSSGEGFVNLAYVEDFKLSRLKFETNGKIYNSYVADDPDDGGTDFDNVEPIKDWFDEMIDWVKKNPLYAVLIILAVIVGLPLIISFLPMILKGLIQLVIGIIKLLFWIISLPFKAIKLIFKGGKKDE